MKHTQRMKHCREVRRRVRNDECRSASRMDFPGKQRKGDDEPTELSLIISSSFHLTFDLLLVMGNLSVEMYDLTSSSDQFCEEADANLEPEACACVGP